MQNSSNFIRELPVKVKLNGEVEKTVPASNSYDELKTRIKKEFNISQITAIEFINDFGEVTKINNTDTFSAAILSTNGQYHYFLATSPKNVPLDTPIWQCNFCLFDKNTREDKNCKICGRERQYFS